MCKVRIENKTIRIEEWTQEERAELAIPEFDPEYLPAGMSPPGNWFTESGDYVGATLELVRGECGRRYQV